ncbi:tRNA lysidine(34) synthetase TilS [Risungbinella massiliensis]|uniref:tRNA lysidine(34) synthetase TilS n=1 Tax=Risungbinella massiliensis TaxID=1329796 RepID=UPI0005CC44CB|nr:tRNA lysidine(34) synthetase TilS [Risungbinella massiliensis]
MFLTKLEKTVCAAPFHFGVGEKMLVAVSGGPDSMALLHGLNQLAPKYQWDITVVHINHQLRDMESEAEQDYVCRYCERNNIPVVVERVEVKLAKQEMHAGTQEVARHLRYEAFQKVAIHMGIDRILLAHHADDQMETILWNMIRGTGITGLKGMQQVRLEGRISYLRPLLYFDRNEIEQYCEMEKIEPRTDSSNRSRDYTRNRIRLDLIPYLKEFNPRIKEGMLELSEIVLEEDRFLRQLEKDAFGKVVQTTPDGEYEVEIPRFLELPIALQRRVVKLILSCLSQQLPSLTVTFQVIERIRNLAQGNHPSGKLDLGAGAVVQRFYHKLVYKHELVEDLTIQAKRVPIPGTFWTPLGVLHTYTSEQLHKLPEQNIAVFDQELLARSELIVRSRRDGDRISSKGMNGRKKVKDVLMEAKIPRVYRDSYPIITLSNDEILWLPGLRRSVVAPVTNQTKQFLYLVWEPNHLWNRLQTLT